MSENKLYIREIVELLLSDFKGTKNELIPILQCVQKQFGYLPESAMQEIARYVSIPESKVYATATFYSEFRFKPIGEKHISVCKGTACHIRGAGKIQETIERQLGITEGETTADRQYSLETVACIGCCALAPCMTVNKETVHGNLTPRKAVSIITEPVMEEEKHAVKNLAG
jgi:NADH:ubiquinone oxidoreductase subunit E